MLRKKIHIGRIVFVVIIAIGVIVTGFVLVTISTFFFALNNATAQQKTHVITALKQIKPLPNCYLVDNSVQGTPNIDLAYNRQLTYDCQPTTAGALYDQLKMLATQNGFTVTTTDANSTSQWDCYDETTCQGSFSFSGTNVSGTYLVTVRGSKAGSDETLDNGTYLRTQMAASYQIQIEGD